MRKPEKYIIYFFTGLIAILFAGLAINLYINDFTPSIIPGWHTTVYPLSSYALLALVVLIPCLITYLILTGLFKLWLAFVKRKKQ